MKLTALKLLLASLAVSTFAVAGCAADTTAAAPDDDSEDAVVSQEITARATQFVGTFEWKGADSENFVEIQSLTLKADGSYSGKVDASLVNKNVKCIAFPCTLPESGKWSVTSSAGKLKIKLDSAGSKPARGYFAEINPLSKILSLTRFGTTTKLFFQGSTCANVKCTSGTHCEMKGINGGSVPACIQDAPQPACSKQGCSGQICADHSVITTCEFRPEFACFHSATCARQADGNCGWTQTPALTACLGK